MSETSSTTPGSSAAESERISPIAKAGSALFGGGTVMCVLFAFVADWKMLGILMVGILLVGGLLLLYRLLLLAWQKRKALPLTRGVLGNASVSPQQISEPAKRAKLDDLRRSFEGGIAKFRAAGKDLYTLPWYVMLGEPAAGKTEAIRRCNVGFPPGLQDYAQGAGGTINMNWWFTNHAIILDTAGRVLFEEVATGANSEFKEFLRLLSQNRPNCPINGLLLVIPSDSLIKDSADAIERKAGKIAQQLDVIQRTLGVRFPVFVIVTKCDLINGFREFFESLDNPQLQHQMLGWSNPAALDAAFNPQHVDQHLETVRRRLVRRRYTLMLDPVHTEDPDLRRIDQVDALYTFPDAFIRIGPRLKRYMEMIFTVGEWSPKPLFLRGIYFTSSMREGSALDAELAEILKVPVESLSEGKMWERERAYFLRDLFVKKVFVEKGLVTRATNSKKLQRRRQLTVIGSSIAAILILGGMTWYGTRAYSKSLDVHRDFWVAVKDGNADPKWALVDKPQAKGFREMHSGVPQEPVYHGADEIEAGNVKTLNELLVEFPEIVTTPINVPHVFALLARVEPNSPARMRRPAYGIVYERCALEPTVKTARERMAAQDKWSEQATDALAALIQLEADAVKKPEKPQEFPLDALMRYTLSDAEFDKYSKASKARKVSPAEEIYAGNDAPRAWPPERLKKLPEQPITHGIKQFDNYWRQQAEKGSPQMSAVETLIKKLRQYSTDIAEADSDAQKHVRTVGDYEEAKKLWKERADRFAAAETEITALVNADAIKGQDIDVLYRSQAAALKQKITEQYTMLRARAGDSWVKDKLPTEVPTPAELPKDLAALGEFLQNTQSIDQSSQPRYRVYAQLYRSISDQLIAGQQSPKLGALASGLRLPLDDLLPRDAGAESAAKALETADRKAMSDKVRAHFRFGSELADLAGRKQVIEELIAMAGGDKPTAKAIEEQVTKAVGTFHKAWTFPADIPLTNVKAGGATENKFNPSAASNLIKAARACEAWLPSDNANALVLDDAALKLRYEGAMGAVGEYSKHYLDYWTSQVPGLAHVEAPATAETWVNDPLKDQALANEALRKHVQTIDAAIKDYPDLNETARDTVDDNKRILRQPSFPAETRRIFDAWHSPNPDAMRESILSETPDGFARKFLMTSSDHTAAGHYWNTYALRRLTVLNNTWRSVAAKEFDTILRDVKFPLVQPEKTTIDAMNRETFARLAPRVRDFTGAPRASDGKTIGTNANLGELGEAFEKSLTTLRSPYAPKDDGQWFYKVRQIIALLSQAGEARLTYHAKPAPDAVAVPWSTLEIVKGGRLLPAKVDLRGGDAAICSLPLQDPQPIVIQLATHPNVGQNRVVWSKLKLETPWPAVEMIFRADSATQVPGDPTKWELMAWVGDGNMRRQLWMHLDFDKELPAKNAWPRK